MIKYNNEKIMFSLAIISAMNLYGCYDMNTLSVKPSTTTVTYYFYGN